MSKPSAPSTFSGVASSDTQTWYERAHALLDQAHYETALESFRCAAQVFPTADNFVSQAVCFIHLNRPQAALGACDRAISLQADYRQAWLFRGVALHRLGRTQEAYVCYRKAVDPAPQSALPRLVWQLKARLRPLKIWIQQATSSHLPHC